MPDACFSLPSCNGLFAALVSLNVPVLVSMETKRGVENHEALLWSPALSCVLPAAAAAAVAAAVAAAATATYL